VTAKLKDISTIQKEQLKAYANAKLGLINSDPHAGPTNSVKDFSDDLQGSAPSTTTVFM